LLLGTVAFFLYLALYLVDLAVLHLTFVPGSDLPWRSLSTRLGIMTGARQALSDPESRKLIWGHLQIAWHVYFGSHYRPGAALRTVDTLLHWSFALDIAALCVAVLLVYWMWCHAQPDSGAGSIFRAPHPVDLLLVLIIVKVVFDKDSAIASCMVAAM
jgi:hypothetical protein